MCEPATISMMVIAVAMAVKTSMDAKANAATQRKNAIAKQALEREAMLKQRAEQGDADALEAFNHARKARADAAKIKVASGEQGASTGSMQTNAMLAGLGFGTGLQTAADERSATNSLERNDLQLRSSGINFTNTMRTINSNDPSGFDIAVGAAGAAAGAWQKGGAITPGAGPKTVGNLNAQAIRGV